MKKSNRVSSIKAKRKPISLSFSKLERMAKKRGLPVFAVLDLIVQQTINN